MRKKLIIYVAVGIVVLLILGGGLFALTMRGDDEVGGEEYPLISSYPEDTINFATSEEVMIGDGQTVYFPISPNGSQIMIMTEATATISWEDDEIPPSWRLTYENKPDTMTLGAHAESMQGNESHTQSVESTRGTANIMLNMKNAYGVVKGSGESNWTFDEQGVSQIPGNASFYVNVSCTAGHIESNRPALLYYSDPGDGVILTITIKYRMVPENVYNYWKQTSESLGGMI